MTTTLKKLSLAVQTRRWWWWWKVQRHSFHWVAAANTRVMTGQTEISITLGESEGLWASSPGFVVATFPRRGNHPPPPPQHAQKFLSLSLLPKRLRVSGREFSLPPPPPSYNWIAWARVELLLIPPPPPPHPHPTLWRTPKRLPVCVCVRSFYRTQRLWVRIWRGGGDGDDDVINGRWISTFAAVQLVYIYWSFCY